MSSIVPSPARPSLRTHARPLALLLAMLASAAGCRPDSRASAADGGAAATDAGNAGAVAAADGGATDGSDAATSAETDRTLRIVAEAEPMGGRVTVTETGRAFVIAGPLVYEPKPDGTLALLGTPSSYATLYAGNENDLVGFLAHPRADHVIDAADGAIDVKLFGDAAASGFHLEKGTLAPLDDTTMSARMAASPPPAFPFGSPGTPPGVCVRIPAFDGKTYARCRTTKSPDAKRPFSFHVRTGTGAESAWREVFTSVKAVADHEMASVANDGSLYVVNSTRDAVMRCPATPAARPDAPDAPDASGATACEKVAMEIGDGPKGYASYTVSYTDLLDRDSKSSFVSIDTVNRAAANAKSSVVFDSVVARSASDVWAFGRATQVQSRLVFHTGKPRERVGLPTAADARVLVRNEKPASPWVGHCEQVFVRIAGAPLAAPPGSAAAPDAAGAADGKIDIAAAKAKLADVKAILEQRNDDDYYGSPLVWSLVDGRLHDERVVGIVVARADGEVKLERMEKAVEKIADKLTTNPMSRPRVTCTLPVLANVLATRTPVIGEPQ